jgi:hypothetical protein
MKDVNGVELEVGQTVVIAAKSSTGANVPNLKRATILEVFEGNDTTPLPHIKVKYEESGRTCKLDGYPGTGYGMDHRVCVI